MAHLLGWTYGAGFFFAPVPVQRMNFRASSALLLILSACAASAPIRKENAQVAPVGPLVVPRPMTVPAPVGLNPPVPLGVVPEELPGPRPRPSSDKDPGKEPAPALTSERRPECTPQRVPHRGGNDLHNRCADNVPNNSFPGGDVLVSGKHFDALQLATRTLWEVKTNALETYTPYVRRTELKKQVEEARRERDLAAACGYQFFIGVRTEAHKAALRERDRSLDVVVMNWC